MNILFIDNDADPPYFGGTTTLTRLQADILEEEGHHCILGYMNDFEYPSVLFKDKIKVSSENIEVIKNLCSQKRINYVICQMDPVDKDLLQLFREYGAQIIYAYYAQPQMYGVSRKDFVRKAKQSTQVEFKVKCYIKYFLYPFFKKRLHKSFERFYQIGYDNCDIYLLLSKQYLKNLREFVPYADENKVVALPPPNTYNEFFPLNLLNSKKKEVLEICRFSYEKRVEETLRIWKKIENDPELDDWVLNLIGDGEDRHKLKSLAKRLKLRHVRFLGQIKAPLSYYNDASIYMMTSEFEGWPMVLNECQQFGTVPIAYDSFAAIYDIIKDGKNGIIVKNNDRNLYVEKLKILMKNESKRKEMMANAIEYSHHHTKEQYKVDFLNIFKE